MSMTERYQARVGQKGQVVIVKGLREKHGIREGGLVEQISTDNGVLVIPVSSDKLLKELDSVAEEVAKTWPRGVSAVEAIKEDRDKRWQKKSL